MYAEVAIPLNVHQTFTYRLPESFAATARAGCRVLVPFGKQLLTGYIVDLHETLEEAGHVVVELHDDQNVEEILVGNIFFQTILSLHLNFVFSNGLNARSG